MAWSTSADITAFVAAAGGFLASRPIDHGPLLTEADHVYGRPDPDADQAYGWWTNEHGAVAGAFLRAPRHAAILTPMPEPAVEELVAVLQVDGGLGCDVTTVDAVLAAWERAGVVLAPRHRLVVHRLDAFRPPATVRGTRADPAPASDVTRPAGQSSQGASSSILA